MEFTDSEIELILILKRGWLETFDLNDDYQHLREAYNHLADLYIVSVDEDLTIELSSKGREIAKQFKRKVDQTLFGDGSNGERPGNCLQACLAMIFEINLNEVPHFIEYKSEWFDKMQSWLSDRFDVYALDVYYYEDSPPQGFSILTGKSDRGIQHAVVCRDGQLYHDPHPDRTGIKIPERHRVFVRKF